MEGQKRSKSLKLSKGMAGLVRSVNNGHFCSFLLFFQQFLGTLPTFFATAVKPFIPTTWAVYTGNTLAVHDPAEARRLRQAPTSSVRKKVYIGKHIPASVPREVCRRYRPAQATSLVNIDVVDNPARTPSLVE